VSKVAAAVVGPAVVVVVDLVAVGLGALLCGGQEECRR